MKYEAVISELGRPNIVIDGDSVIFECENRVSIFNGKRQVASVTSVRRCGQPLSAVVRPKKKTRLRLRLVREEY